MLNLNALAAPDDILSHAARYEVIETPEGQPVFTVAYFGKNFGEDTNIDWTLPCENERAMRRVSAVLRAMGPHLYYAPNTSTSNAERVPRSKLLKRLALEDDIRLFGNKTVPGDTLTLERGEGMVNNPAGCGLALAAYRETYNGSHLSRRSLLCINRILNQIPWRFNESVTGTLMRSLGAPVRPKQVRVWLRCFTPQERIVYSLKKEDRWANTNRLILEYVIRGWGAECVTIRENSFLINLVVLARKQLEKLGVPPENIDTEGAFLPDDGTVWLDGAQGTPRNLQVVVKH